MKLTRDVFINAVKLAGLELTTDHYNPERLFAGKAGEDDYLQIADWQKYKDGDTCLIFYPESDESVLLIHTLMTILVHEMRTLRREIRD